jgi:chorismate synthase
MLRFLTAGESHGQALVAMVESFPAAFEISVEEINRHLARRQQGYGRGKRMRIEKDRATILSGLRNGRTLGSPVVCLIENKDWPNWKELMDPVKPISRELNDKQRRLAYKVTAPRPGHADLAGAIKYNTHDLRSVLERASARETAARVACGSIARQLLEYFDIRIVSHVVAVGSARLGRKRHGVESIEARADKSPVRCVDPQVSEKMITEIKEAMTNKDTVGGVFEVRAANLPVGLGSNAQWFARLDAALAAAVMSIQSVKGVEIGGGFSSSQKRGSRVHDRIYYNRNEKLTRQKGFVRRTNTSGGVEGGISNGSELVIRAACKPISTLMQPLDTVDINTWRKTAAMVERSDICIVPAAAVVGEAMVAMVLASAFTDKFGGDSRAEIEANFEAYLKREF